MSGHSISVYADTSASHEYLCTPLTYNRTGQLAQYFLPEVMRGQLNVTNADEYESKYQWATSLS